jgi:hypothetical protein
VRERFKAGECRSALSAIPDVARDSCVIEFQTQVQETGIDFETSIFALLAHMFFECYMIVFSCCIKAKKMHNMHII